MLELPANSTLGYATGGGDPSLTTTRPMPGGMNAAQQRFYDLVLGPSGVLGNNPALARLGLGGAAPGAGGTVQPPPGSAPGAIPAGMQRNADGTLSPRPGFSPGFGGLRSAMMGGGAMRGGRRPLFGGGGFRSGVMGFGDGARR